ncbi:MAG: selenide, water dikinase SelD [Bacteroidales bacterium]|jgi:cysteine desulfurase NifS/selenium donor protein|nr:selenide, water dikinase SelD [Bacteroidales bacterium]
MEPIYLDYNATTPMSEEVVNAMKPYLDVYFGNPSSSHTYGNKTKQAVEEARKQVADLLNCNPDEITFTSGGSESNNYAIKGVAYNLKSRGNHIITSAIEHPAVTEVCEFLKTEGFRITYIPVDETGVVNPEDIKAAIGNDTILISVMHANNETGMLQPIKDIAAIAKEHNIIMHVDAAQSIGKVSVDIEESGVDLLSVAAHKFYGPKGIGALYVKRGVKLQKLIHGADHERNMRAGTENVLEIVGLGKAAEQAKSGLEKNGLHMRNMRDKLYNAISEKCSDIKVNGDLELCLPNTLSLSFKGIEANTLLSELKDIAASAGAACHTDSIDVSHVLSAMNVPVEFAMGTIRLSTGKYTTDKDIDSAAQMIIDAVERLKPTSDKFIADTAVDNDEYKLTRYTHGMGCACKIRPQYLERILSDMPVSITDENILIDKSNNDDAAVYRIGDNRAMVQTLDFFTPIVDDPYTFGAIAASNALSDVYAMGAKPVFALNIVGFPDKRLPEAVLSAILKGAADKASEAGIAILGGHTVEDTEPKFGMVVSGIVDEDKVLSNNKAKVGDKIILTKPLGTGIISTALKAGAITDTEAKEASDSMAELNRYAAEEMLKFDVSTATDVTGFGLIGHLKEVAEASDINVNIYSDRTPLFNNTMNLVMQGHLPGGTKNNLDFVSGIVEWDKSVSEQMRYILCDAQTSGGLLIFVNEKDSDKLLNNLKGVCQVAEIIGEVVGKGATINVL